MQAGIALAVLCLLLVAPAALAQGDQLQLFLSRSFGFSLGNQIQGQFSLTVSGPAGLSSVTYYLDGQEMATVTKAPFSYSFSTDTYPLGMHRLAASAVTASGQTLRSNPIDVEMVSAAAGWQSTGRLLIPIFGVVLLVVVLMVAVQVLPFGGKRRYEPGETRSYGAAGGAICPKCGRPFARSLLAPNLLFGKLERCPYCGKWSITRPATMEALRAAEQAEVQAAAPLVPEPTPEEQLRRQIEESRLSR